MQHDTSEGTGGGLSTVLWQEVFAKNQNFGDFYKTDFNISKQSSVGKDLMNFFG